MNVLGSISLTNILIMFLQISGTDVMFFTITFSRALIALPLVHTHLPTYERILCLV